METQMNTKPHPAPKLPPLEIPPSLLATDAFEVAFRGVDDPAVAETLRAQRLVAESFKALNLLRVSRDPDTTPAKHLRATASAAEKARSAAVARSERARAAIAARLVDVQREIDSAVLGEPSKDAEEIRRVLRAMPDRERQKAITDAIEGNDRALLGAVFRGHPVAVGLDQKGLAAFRRLAEGKLARPHLEHKEALLRADRLGADVAVAATETAMRALGNREAMDEFERESRLHDEALLSFAAATDL
jgi:hypothetical protein